MSNIPNKLRFCCLPVLPTIFSNELSYLDVLSKMRDYINQMIEALKQQDEDIANIQKQVDKVDPSNYIQTSGGTLTGPLFFIDQNSVVKNADGTFTIQSNNPVVLKGGQTVAVNATGGIELRSGGTALITGADGVSILDKTSAGVAVYEGNTAIAGNIEINGPTTFENVDVDMLNARTKVAEPVEDANPVNLKYFNEHKVSGGDVTCGYITVAVDDSKTTVDVHSERLIPKGELGGHYVDNAGNLWHATQVVAGGFTLENQNINVLANAEFVRITGNTSVKNINVNDTGSSTYQATTNVLVNGGRNVNITADNAVDITGSTGVEILTGNNGTVAIEGGGVSITGDINVHGTMKFDQNDTLDARGAGVLVDEPMVDGAPVNLKYFNENKGSGGGAAMKQFDTTNGIPMIPIANIPSSGGAIFYMTITTGDKNNQNNTQLYNGSITTYNGKVTDVRILNIGWLSSGDGVECNWFDSGQVTKTTDGIQLDINATEAGFTGWYAKIA